MPTVILVRHGRTAANADGVLAGRLPGVTLDETGVRQAEATAARLADVPISTMVVSPMERCQQTADIIARAQPTSRPRLTDEALAEVDYGEWQGRDLADLAKEDLWTTVQRQPSAVTFPGGESLRQMRQRAVDAIRGYDRSVGELYGPDAVWVAVSHGDVLKAVISDAYGMHLDLFQRVQVAPASVSVVQYGAHRTSVVCVNTSGGDLGWLGRTEPADGAPVGGGPGHS
ncbi:MAG: MSMEG_4193 family putative phosphomutase [Aeromicrobium sp.]|uniref:MSMEG_4193 family putative phosphomutase n=1 Tax=Aeromicrobium sp. TaxID=1871063 RepID=UPI0039E300A7